MMSDSMHVYVVGRLVEEQSGGDTCMRMHLIMKRASPIVTSSMSVRKNVLIAIPFGWTNDVTV